MATLVQLKALAKKQGLSPSGTKPMIAKRLLHLRKRYLTKSQIKMLTPLTKKVKTIKVRKIQRKSKN